MADTELSIRDQMITFAEEHAGAIGADECAAASSRFVELMSQVPEMVQADQDRASRVMYALYGHIYRMGSPAQAAEMVEQVASVNYGVYHAAYVENSFMLHDARGIPPAAACDFPDGPYRQHEMAPAA
jgi:hypothetical protein